MYEVYENRNNRKCRLNMDRRFELDMIKISVRAWRREVVDRGWFLQAAIEVSSLNELFRSVVSKYNKAVP